jgi:hypothetical protein
MTGKVIFYSLSQKFLERDEQPAAAETSAPRQVIYQTLGLGHHIGVIDCFKRVIECPLDAFGVWLDRLPDGEARRKLEGVVRFGEIMIDSTHTRMLAAALDRTLDAFTEVEREWARTLIGLLAAIDAEPAMYLMVKRRDD